MNLFTLPFLAIIIFLVTFFLLCTVDQPSPVSQRYKQGYFLKDRDQGESSKKKVRKTRAPKPAISYDEKDLEDGFRLITQKRKKEKILFRQGEDVSVKAVLEKLSDVLATRGKRRASHLEQRQLLRKLMTVSLPSILRDLEKTRV